MILSFYFITKFLLVSVCKLSVFDPSYCVYLNVRLFTYEVTPTPLATSLVLWVISLQIMLNIVCDHKVNPHLR